MLRAEQVVARTCTRSLTTRRFVLRRRGTVPQVSKALVKLDTSTSFTNPCLQIFDLHNLHKSKICVTPSHVPCIFLSLAPKVLRTEQAVARTLCPFGAKRNRCVRCVCFDLCAKLRQSARQTICELFQFVCVLSNHTFGVWISVAKVRGTYVLRKLKQAFASQIACESTQAIHKYTMFATQTLALYYVCCCAVHLLACTHKSSICEPCSGGARRGFTPKVC